MRLDPKDLAYLKDIQMAGTQASSFIKGYSQSAYLKDARTQRAVERALEIIGEASHCLSDAAREALPEIPWKDMIGLRNLLIHNYGKIDSGRIWTTAHKAVPILQKQLAKVLGS